MRATLIAVAVAAAAWMAVALRSHEQQREAFSLAAAAPGNVSPARLDAAAADVRRARRGMPDAQPLRIEAALLQRHGRSRAAVAALERAVRLEPEDAITWLQLSRSAAGEPRRAEALEAVRRLAPPVPPPEP
jgi:predicted Zn-dependent protease